MIKVSLIIPLDAQFSSITYPSDIQGYVTGANDGKLIFYDLNGNCRELCETPPNVHCIFISILSEFDDI